jgi:hypothetical protein
MSYIALLCDRDLALEELNHVEACLLAFEVALLDLETGIKTIAKVIPYRQIASSKQV